VKVELDQSCTTDEDDLNSSQESGRGSRSPPLPLPSVEEVMKKWNMFQFGEVVVPNHPTIPVVPMALQMVYLYPLARGEGGEVRYRMLVPMHHLGGGTASPPPPNFVSGSSPSSPGSGGGGGLLHLAPFPGAAAAGLSMPTPRPPSSGQDSNGRGGQLSPAVKRAAEGHQKASPPLDLTNKSPEKEENNGGGGHQQLQHQHQQQRFLESQISLIKIKELELLKNAASVSAAATASAVSPVNSSNNHRCNDCNINFTKYQNYLAHKKYYCSGVKQQQQQQHLLHEQDEPEVAAAAAGSSHEAAPPQLRQLGPPKCKSPRAAQERIAREMLLKQQEALQTSILAGMKNAALPLLIPNSR
jgi:hypothetical protein